MRFLIICIGFSLLLFPAKASAQSAGQELGTCLTDNTTGKDRKELARWVFTAMSAHPEIDSLAAVTASDREEVARRTGVLFTRLVTESCVEEVQAAIDTGRQSVFTAGFEILGRVAMEELMRDEQVATEMEQFTRYIDRERMEETFQ